MDRVDALKPQQENALRRELTQALDPGADTRFARDVLNRLDSPRPQALGWMRGLQWAGAALALGICAAIGVRLAPSTLEAPAGLVARGGAPQTATLLGFEAYRHPHGEPPRRIQLRNGDLLPSGDGLTFALLNRGPSASAARILVMDAQQSISWLEPAEDSTDNAVPVAPRRTVDLPDGVTLTDLPPGTTRLIAVFGAADQPRAALEKALQRGGVGALEQLPGVISVQSLALTTP